MQTPSRDTKRRLKKVYGKHGQRAADYCSALSTAGDQFKKQMTDHVLLEDTIQESEKKYRTLVDNLPQKIFHKNRNSVYVSCNKNYADDLKINPEEIAGKTDYDFYPKALADKYRADDNQVMETGVIKAIEERYVCDGKRQLVQTVKAPIKDEENNIIGILGIFWDITDRKRVEQKLITYQRNLRALASQITSIEEQAREKCAIFLHDSIGQSLSFLKVKLALLAKTKHLKEKKTDVDAMLTAVNKLIGDTRFLTFELMPPMLYQLGLGAGLEWLVEQIGARENITIQFEDDGQPKPLDKQSSIMLFRSVQELLNNIVKHAKAHTVKVSFERDNNNIRISVEDDGMGFNAAKRHVSKNAGKGFGLFSIEERLGQLGGEFNIESRLKHGTRASLMLPLTAYKRSKSDKCWTGEKEIR